MADKLTIYSQNCQGLSNPQKRRGLFRHVRSKGYNIICLQDVHITSSLESYITAEWGFKVYLSSFTSASRGVMVLLNNNFEHKVERVKIDQNGNFIVLDIIIQEKRITLVNLYGPNEDKPQFYNNIRQTYSEFGNDYKVLCGDWNLVLNPDLDTYNYMHINNPRARQEVLKTIEEDNLIDIWRVFHEEEKGFTWSRKNPVRKQARLDFFLVNDSFFPYVTDTNIVSSFRSDHQGISINFEFNSNERGRGYWKFNNLLLKDKDYIKIVKDTVEEAKAIYARRYENISNEDIVFDINDQLFLETLLLMIRGNTIKYSSFKKRKKHEEEIKLESEIKIIEDEINKNFGNISEDVLQTLGVKKELLNELRNEKLQGVLLRSRCRYEELGEKPTSYFFNLENRNFTNKVINKLVDDNDNQFVETSEILNCQREFYKTLYNDFNTIDNNNIQSVLGENPRKLDDETAGKLEGELSYTELSLALKNMKNNKTPGLDGFTVEFFKFFWVDVGQFILRSLNYGYRTGSLSVTQKQGIITCLPKPNKARDKLKNWRPISLLNVVYKLASSVIANRIKGVLNDLIHEDQKGFISGRYIGENIRLIYDVLFETKNQNIPGLILSIDFEKAFDTVSWHFIEKTLDYFNFGESIKKWISIFEKGAESSILQNGHMSEFFFIRRGCRQGDPISPYIFILCAEVLGQMMRKNENIKGIIINNKEFKISQYADDTQLFLDGSDLSLRESLETLNKYYNMSGLKINVEKTKAMWIGAYAHSNRILCREYQLDWNQNPFVILGVTFSVDVNDIWELNNNSIMNKVINTLNQWAKRKLTLMGRITIIKSIALSKFVHLFLSLPDPPSELIKQLERRFFKFLWNNGPDRISRKVIIRNLSCGGLRMVQLTSFIKALKISWLRRIISSSGNNKWSDLSGIDFAKLFSVGGSFSLQLSNTLDNPFWRDLTKHWSAFCQNIKIESIKQVLESPIWFNTNVGLGQLFIKEWYKKGVKTIYDLIDENGDIYTFNTFKERFNVRGTFLEYQNLLNKIPNEWKNIINNNTVFSIMNKMNVSSNIYVSYVIKDKKGSRIFYDMLVGINEINLHTKWQAVVGEINDQDWRSYNTYVKKIKEVKLKDFQFKINNKILVTNSFLRKINKIDTDRCGYCQNNPETISHLFLECNRVKEFWDRLKMWMNVNVNLNLILEDRNILFSTQNNNELISYILLLAKYYIYKNKFVNKQLSIPAFLLYVKVKLTNERYIANIHNTFDGFLKKWHPIYNYFNSQHQL